MITLIPSQMPQQDLGMIAQVLMGQGFVQQPASERNKESHAIVFYTQDKSNIMTMKFYQDIGTLRVDADGPLSERIALALGQYMEALNADSVADLFDKSQSDMERRVYAILLVLAYPDALSALSALHDKYIKDGSDATREGIIQGFAFLETPDVGMALESIEAEFKGQPVAALCRKGIDALSDRGIIRESIGSFIAKIMSIVDSEPANALEKIEKYCENNPDASALRALKARALARLGRTDEATALLATIDLSDPDAPEAFCERAKLREAAKFVDQALRDIQCAITCDPTNEEAQIIFRRLSMLAGHKEASDEEKLAQFTNALDENPDDANLLCQRAEVLLKMGEYEKARADAIHARKVSPKDPRLPLILGEALLNMRWLGSALEQASLAQKNFMPNQQIEAQLLKVRVFLALNRVDAAVRALHEVGPEIHDAAAVRLYAAILAELAGTPNYDGLSRDEIVETLRHLPVCIYSELPVLRGLAGDALAMPHAPLAQPMDAEPTDPYFKRCDACGALTMARRTLCKECSNGTFF